MNPSFLKQNPMQTEIIFKGRVPGNNKEGGLLRMHHRERKALKQKYIFETMASTRNRHKGPVRLELIRHSIGRAMDYDNLVSTGKILIDALVTVGVLPDDNTEVIVQREYTQTKALKKETQMTVIRITDVLPVDPEDKLP